MATITLAVEHDSTISWPYEKSLAANTPGDAADPNWHPSACNICGQASAFVNCNFRLRLQFVQHYHEN